MTDMLKSVLRGWRTVVMLAVLLLVVSVAGTSVPAANMGSKSGACADLGATPEGARMVVLELREDCNR